jgi:hypothetical protein
VYPAISDATDFVGADIRFDFDLDRRRQPRSKLPLICKSLYLSHASSSFQCSVSFQDRDQIRPIIMAFFNIPELNTRTGTLRAYHLAGIVL